MIVPLADRLEAIVTFAFDESRGTLGAFEVEELVGAELEVIELAALVCISACELSVFPSVVESDAAREEFTVGLVTASV